jgi:hypothetical protein
MATEQRSRLAALEYLVGEWEGRGAGPTFAYRERVTVAWTLKERFLSYRAEAHSTDDGRLLHSEEGYLGWDEAADCPFALFVYPFGVVERASGTLAGETLDLTTAAILAIPPGYPFRSLHRRIEPTAAGWSYTLNLDTGRGPGPEHHALTRLELHRVAPAPANPLVAELGRLPERVEALLTGHTEEDLQRRPAPGEWSAKEIACHLRDAARIYHERLFLTATHERPFLAGYDEAALARDRNYQEADTGRIVPEMRSWREETVGLLVDLPPEGWDRTAIHGELGEITLLQLAAHMVEHEAGHTRDLTQLLQGQ